MIVSVVLQKLAKLESFGIDFTPEMIEKGEIMQINGRFLIMEFRLGDIEKYPLMRTLLMLW